MTPLAPIGSIAIVNRGEAAMRCVRAVKYLRARERSKLRAIVLYTELDRAAPFVRQADVAIPLPVRESEVGAYLDHDLVIGVLGRAGADAVWPGWGFVSEDADFADRVVAAGMRFLGPSGAAMRALGDKISAKRLAEKAGVPVTPWSDGVVAEEDEAVALGARLGYPLVVKAAAGGGGRGIRMVDDASALRAAFRSAGSEARAAFGDGRLFLERKVAGGRHIEVQVAGDLHGHVLAVGCRDCSVQRRHQKVIEEAPPPLLGRERLQALVDAATRIAREAGYAGVGTVEFLVAGEGFYFLEMNPRLQVEHGITEAITGVDLVELQIRIARGENVVELSPVERGVAIEARVCAEDPDAGFLPAPGRIARFDPALGPRVRIDSGVVAGSVVPPAFDSLIAKVIATGETREEARARLVTALADFDLVIEGGATNKGYLIELLDAPEFRAGGVDTGWLDRRAALPREGKEGFGPEALIAAAILAYQRRRRDARINFYADTSNIALSRVPPSVGQQIELSHRGASYRLAVFALGSWRYRVRLGEHRVTATLQEEDAHAARLTVGDRSLRVLHDASDAGLRLEVEGDPYRFGWQTAGEVRAGTPAMVVAIQVEVGERVTAGQALGLLEAMKMEIAFRAPVAGVVTKISVRTGQQVAAGDILLVIEPVAGDATPSGRPSLLELPAEVDPLAPLFAVDPAGGLGKPDLGALDRLDAAARKAAIAALRAEARGVLLGYDADPARAEKLVAFLEAPLPARLSRGLGRELAAVRAEVVLFADLEQLFLRAPRVTASSEVEPSNNARLRMYVRRMHAGGAGIADDFLELLRAALKHYGISELTHGDALERALLRLLAAQRSPDPGRPLVLAMLRRLAAVARTGVRLEGDRALESSLAAISGMRELVGDAVADAAIEASDVIFEEPKVRRQVERAARRIDPWLTSAESGLAVPPHDVLLDLAAAPRAAFDRLGAAIADAAPRRRAIALGAWLYRLYAPEVASFVPLPSAGELVLGRLELGDGRVVIGCASGATSVASAVAQLPAALGGAYARRRGHEVDAVELLMPAGSNAVEPAAELLSARSAAGLACRRLTVSRVGAEHDQHWTFLRDRDVLREDPRPCGLHPEVARRVDLQRLSEFELERILAAEGMHCFHGRSRSALGDERIFVLAEVRGRLADDRREAGPHLATFERVFHDAARTLRSILALRDPERRLQWNRIAIFVAPEMFLDAQALEGVARRLAPAARRLGLERVLVRLNLLDRAAPELPARSVEVVVTDITGQRMEIITRGPRRAPLAPVTAYERKVVEARRRRLTHPYEVLRILTGREHEGSGPAPAQGELPEASFVEHDLEPGVSPPHAVSVAGRPWGENRSSIVFGIIRTPTEKVPEGMRRVLILSDPTLGMGSLAAPECDRVCAAIDLAERLSLPVEWLPISSGARIAMDSGTENLDATARVVRRIVSFTQRGGVIHLIVHGVNVGAQSYWNALATMLGHTRGALIMTPGASMVLTGRGALEASGGVAAEDEVAIGGFERIMGPNGEAQYYASDLVAAYRTLYEHYRFTYVVPGERTPRLHPTADPDERPIGDAPYPGEAGDFRTVGEIFADATNPGRKRPFAMRPVMHALIDQDGGWLERWRSWAGAETAVVWEAHLGGVPICLIGIESHNLTRAGYRSLDGPAEWTGGTLFPLSSKKVARALNAASGNRPVVVLANLSGFDGSPESMRRLQLEHGAEIARAVVNFQGPLLFFVVSRYHGGAYVVFSKALNDGLRASALTGSHASVIGGAPAALVVFSREVRARAASDPRVQRLREALRAAPTAAAREAFERGMEAAILGVRAKLAAEFDAIHSVERARRVGSLDEIVEPAQMRSYLIGELRRGLERSRAAGGDDTPA